MSTLEKGKKITEGVSFRLGKSLLNELRREAEQRQISLNTFASQILAQYMNWHFNAPKTGWIPIQREMLRKLMDNTGDEEIRTLADYIARNPMQELILLLRREYDFATFLDVMEAWLKVSQFPYNHSNIDEKHVFVIQHDLGHKWSNYMAQLFHTACEELASRPEIQITDNSIILKVDAVKCGVASIRSK
jgi:hypothetical protein